MTYEQDKKQNTTPVVKDADWRELPGLLWRGMGMGVAEVIPGVSGGTIALITGVLERFVNAIRSVDMTAIGLLLKFRIKELFAHVHWRFFAMLFAGQLLGIILCTRIIPLPRLLNDHPEPMLGLFFGLILASAVMLAREAGKPGLRGIIAYIIGGLIGTIVVMGVRTDTPETPWFILICGAIAICAWILPGVSGSFVLLLLRKYDYVWSAISFHNNMSFTENMFNVIIPFGAGAVLGIAVFSRLLSWVMKRWHRATMMAMTGLLIASLWAVFPFQNRVFETVASGKEKLISSSPYVPSLSKFGTADGLMAVCLAVMGFVLVMYIDYRARQKRQGLKLAYKAGV